MYDHVIFGIFIIKAGYEGVLLEYRAKVKDAIKCLKTYKTVSNCKDVFHKKC